MLESHGDVGAPGDSDPDSPPKRRERNEPRGRGGVNGTGPSCDSAQAGTPKICGPPCPELALDASERNFFLRGSSLTCRPANLVTSSRSCCASGRRRRVRRHGAPGAGRWRATEASRGASQWKSLAEVELAEALAQARPARAGDKPGRQAWSQSWPSPRPSPDPDLQALSEKPHEGPDARLFSLSSSQSSISAPPPGPEELLGHGTPRPHNGEAPRLRGA
mmetsp:Transcript_96/g.337  ORF Transcript_96/g.337 Transcript_96/m.337 type:complete len:220 (+) Transcript_96:259-918(+)